MLDSIPGGDEMKSLLGDSLYDVWTQLTACIDETYDRMCGYDCRGY